ncbi:Uncharacterised protein [Mycoplasmopsis bovigenitalium]|uniref:Uncharacterized protein n=1 Tax=Mycoplasmopsis bovigenitalium TaxID=2112 RepID=A0A449A9B6_9BACT|nr:hypothetical protein [Mycoplasmopsis bovigenitalium]VEU60879.1 Uncharacterised protein [Mycoplasmopsis bovigenitalium]
MHKLNKILLSLFSPVVVASSIYLTSLVVVNSNKRVSKPKTLNTTDISKPDKQGIEINDDEIKIQNLIKKINDDETLLDEQKTVLNKSINKINSLKSKNNQDWETEFKNTEAKLQSFINENKQNAIKLSAKLEEDIAKNRQKIKETNDSFNSGWSNDFEDSPLSDAEKQYINNYYSDKLQKIEEKYNLVKNKNINEINKLAKELEKDYNEINEYEKALNKYIDDKMLGLRNQLPNGYFDEFLEPINKEHQTQIDKISNFEKTNQAPTFEALKEYNETIDKLNSRLVEKYNKELAKASNDNLRRAIDETYQLINKIAPDSKYYNYIAVSDDELYGRDLRNGSGLIEKLKAIPYSDSDIGHLYFESEKIAKYHEVLQIQKQVIENKKKYFESENYKNDKKYNSAKISDPKIIFDWFKDYQKILNSDEFKDNFNNKENVLCLLVIKKNGETPKSNGFDQFWKLNDINIFKDEKWDELDRITTLSETNIPLRYKEDRFTHYSNAKTHLEYGNSNYHKGILTRYGTNGEILDQYYLKDVYTPQHSWAELITIYNGSLFKDDKYLLLNPNAPKEQQFKKDIFDISWEEFNKYQTKDYLDKMWSFAHDYTFSISEYLKSIVDEKIKEISDKNLQNFIEKYWKPKSDELYKNHIKIKKDKPVLMPFEMQKFDKFKEEFQSWFEYANSSETFKEFAALHKEFSNLINSSNNQNETRKQIIDNYQKLEVKLQTLIENKNNSDDEYQLLTSELKTLISEAKNDLNNNS